MKRRLLFRISYVSVAQYATEALYMVRGLVLARMLGPEVFGVWSAMRLVLLVTRLSPLGSRSGMIQLAPFAEGEGKPRRAEAYRSSATAITFFTSAAAALVLLLVVTLARPVAPVGGWWALLAAVMLAMMLFEHHQIVLISRKALGTYSLMSIAFAALSLAAGLTAAWVFGLAGFLIAMASSYAVVFGVSLLIGPRFRAPRFNRRHAAAVIRTGFPIILGTMIITALWTIDRLLIWVFLGSEPLGVYSIQGYFVTVVMLIPNALVTVLHPHMMSVLGEKQDERHLQPYLEKGTLIFAQVAWPVVGLMFLVMHLPVRWLLPDYVEAIPAGRLLIFASLIGLIGTVPSLVLVSLGRQSRLAGYRAIALAVAAVAIGIAIYSGGGFVAIAAGTAIGVATATTLPTVDALQRLELSPRRQRNFLLWLTQGVILLGVFLIAVHAIVPDEANDWVADLLRTAARCGLFLLAAGPLCFFSVRRLGLFR